MIGDAWPDASARAAGTFRRHPGTGRRAAPGRGAGTRGRSSRHRGRRARRRQAGVRPATRRRADPAASRAAGDGRRRMTSPVMVREAGREACAAVAALESVSFDVPWSIAAVRCAARRWADARVGGTDVERDRRCGACCASSPARVNCCASPSIPTCGGRASARVLLRAVLSAVADACPLGVFLEVRASNVAARRLYAREGFVEQRASPRLLRGAARGRDPDAVAARGSGLRRPLNRGVLPH